MIISIAGRSGSGKTTTVKKLLEILGEDNVCYLHQDSYYKDQSHIPYENRELINYDHPDSIDIELFISHLKDLADNKKVKKPIYDFISHTRNNKTEIVYPKSIILADGIHVMTSLSIRKIVDIKVFVDTDADISFIRRLLRDTKERDRSVEGVINQYIETVKPMQEKYIVPTRKYADFIIMEGGYNMPAIEKLVEMIRAKLK